MTENTTAEVQKSIRIKRTFNLPLKNVWKAWTVPENFKKWFGPENYKCLDCSIDLRVGGKYLNSMQGEDGIKIWSTGTYKEIIPLKKIVYTDSFVDRKGNIIPASDLNLPGEWPLELTLTVDFQEDGGKTHMLLQH